MGDRANIYLVDTPDPSHGIYLYTHWSGSGWPDELRKALERAKPRWGDDSYAARIIVSSVFANIHSDETGGGISTVIGDNSYPIIVVDLVSRMVSFAQEGLEGDRNEWTNTVSFADYVAQDVAHYPSVDAL